MCIRDRNRFRATGEYADRVFVTTMGSPVLRYHAEKEIKKVVKEINEQEAFESVQEQREPQYFEDMYPHAIRHTFCSRCFEAGMQPKVVQSIMGHQHYSTTIDIYTHVSESKYQEEAGKIGRAMEPEEMGNENNKKTDLDNWHWQEKLKLEEHHHLLKLEAEKFGFEKND